MKELATQKVSLGEKIGYSMGDAAANLVFQMMMIFQLKFYTDVFGLDGAVAGSILMIGSLSAIVIDPLVGILSDRTKTRWGKFRPWVLWTAIPFCIFYMLAFYNPGIEEKGMVATYATISYVLLMTVYSFNNIPYTSCHTLCLCRFYLVWGDVLLHQGTYSTTTSSEGEYRRGYQGHSLQYLLELDGFADLCDLYYFGDVGLCHELLFPA